MLWELKVGVGVTIQKVSVPTAQILIELLRVYALWLEEIYKYIIVYI